MSVKPMRVTWANDSELYCCIYASMGLSTKCIMEKTGLSASQVSYRLKKANVKRKDYRDGTSAMAQRVMDRVIPGRQQGIRDMLGLQVIK